jgi:hypothetical protein
MGLRAAVANGNWSNTSTWVGGIIPFAGDVVVSNGFTVTIDQDANVDSITNTAQTNYGIVPVMTSNTAPEGVAFSNSYSTGNEPYRAFDAPASGQSYFSSAAPSVGSPIHLGYEFTSLKIITKYNYAAHGASMLYSPIDFTFEGWDGTNWIILHTVVGHNAITYSSPILSNTTAYLKYRINVTKTGGANFQIFQLSFYDVSSGTSNSVAGGTFNLNSGVTVTCTGTSGITAGINTCLTYSGTGTSTINANINPLTVSAVSNTFTLVHSGTGTLNINGNINASSTNGFRCCLDFSSSGRLNIVGNLSGGFGNNPNARANGTGILTIVGNISGGSNVTSLEISNTVNATITGNLIGGSNSGRSIVLSGFAILTITGNLTANLGGPAINITSGNPQLYVTGIVGLVTQGNTADVALNVAGGSPYVKIIGTIYGGDKIYNFYSVSATAINILTGPFISHPTGIQPIYVSRMHYFRTSGSYFEFRDNSTNGALPPAASAPATRLVAPSTAVDAPSINNVRYGVTYASSSLTGTMRVPSASNVRLGIGVDNTTGTAVLAVSDIWNYLTNNLNTSGSIGDRLKNSATVASTGDQISSFIS